MKACEIHQGGEYWAKVNGKVTRVRVLLIKTSCMTDRKLYDVVNLNTGRQTTFRSAAKFRKPFQVGEAG